MSEESDVSKPINKGFHQEVRSQQVLEEDSLPLATLHAYFIRGGESSGYREHPGGI